MNDEEQRICDRTRNALMTFPLYHESHDVYAKKHDSGTSVMYKTKRGITQEAIESTQFAIQFTDGICYIL